ncbi:MAG: hypothetical protein NT062_06795 [Proteobacteria bacterium]|nr:hypothetical protein [Pseudomonadota bacterium]
MAKRNARGPTLVDVLENPDDLALRMVWADALQQQGDVRGELAAIQLAGRTTYEAWMREHELVTQHGKEWAGAIGHYFGRRVYEGGLFAGGVPVYGFDPDPDNLKGVPGASFDDPAWRAVTTMTGLEDGKRILDEPHVPIRRLREVWEHDAIELLENYARKPLSRVVELGIRPQGDGSARTKLIAGCKALPNLRTLTICGPRPHLAKVLVGSPVLKRIERLGIEDLDRFTSDTASKLVDAAVASRGALREVVLRFSEYAKDLGWQVTLRRDEPGPFTHVIAWWRRSEKARAPKDLADDCIRILNRVDRSKVRSLSIEVGKSMRFPSDSLRTLAEQLAEMPLEHCVVPWQATRLKAAAAGEQRWKLELGLCETLGRIGDAWKVLGPDLGVPWDAMSADGRGTPALGKNPVATLKKRAKGKLRHGLSLVRTGSSDAITLRRHSWVTGTFTTARTPRELATWFAGAVAKLAPEGLAACGLAENVDEINAFDLETYGSVDAGWVVALPVVVSRGLTPTHLAKLGAIPIASPDPTRLVFTIGDDPSAVDDKRARAFAATLVEVLDEVRAAKVPKWFAALVRKQVAPIAKRLKFEKTSDRPLRFVWSRGKRFLRVRLDDTRGSWHVQVETTRSVDETLDTAHMRVPWNLAPVGSVAAAPA